MSQDLSIKIRNELYKRKIKQADLAKELNISQAYLSDILSGKRDGDKARERVNQICKILGIKNEVSK